MTFAIPRRPIAVGLPRGGRRGCTGPGLAPLAAPLAV